MSDTKNLNYKDSIVQIFNTNSYTYLIITLNFLNLHNESISLAIFQSIIYFITTGLSGNFRSIALSRIAFASHTFFLRFLLGVILFPLLIIVSAINTENYLALVFFLGLRKFLDWIDEILLIKNYGSSKNRIYIIVQLFFLIPLPFLVKNYEHYFALYMSAWILSTSFISYKNFRNKITTKNNLKFEIKKSVTFVLNNKKYFTSMLLATLIPCITNLLFRINLSIALDEKIASSIISSYMFGGGIFQVAINLFLPELISQVRNKRHLEDLILRYRTIFLCFCIAFTSLTLFSHNFLQEHNFDFRVIFISFISGFILFYSNIKKQYLIQKMNYTTFSEELVLNLIFISALIFYPNKNIILYFILIPLYFSILTSLLYSILYKKLEKNVLFLSALFITTIAILLLYPKFRFNLFLLNNASFNYNFLILALLVCAFNFPRLFIKNFNKQFYLLVASVSLLICFAYYKMLDLQLIHVSNNIFFFFSFLIFSIYLFKKINEFLNIRFFILPFHFLIFLLLFNKF